MLQLDSDDDRLSGFIKQTKGQKAKDLEDLFANSETREALGISRDQAAVIAAWLPLEMRSAA